MSRSIQSLRGTKDIMGPEALLWERLECAFRDVFGRFGYEEIRTPLLEETALFKHSVGEATDIVRKEMMHFEDRSGLDVCLRPEGTAGVVRAVIEHSLHKEKSTNKFFYYGPMFRAERPQAGRQRQFHQMGAEILGSASYLADAELLEMGARFLQSAGLEGYQIRINNLGEEKDRVAYSQVLKSYFESKERDLCADCKTRLKHNLLRVLDCKESGCQPLIQKAPRLEAHVSSQSRDTFEALLRLLERLEIPFCRDHRVVRGLDYYTGAVYEITHPALGAQDALGAGGRYDGLSERLGGDRLPAAGFALGVERLIIAVKKQGSALLSKADPMPSLAVVALGASVSEAAYAVLSGLREAGFRASMDFEGRSVKAQMRLANKSHARFVVILGEKEHESGKVAVKDMLGDASGGAQTEVPVDQLTNYLREKMGPSS